MRAGLLRRRSRSAHNGHEGGGNSWFFIGRGRANGHVLRIKFSRERPQDGLVQVPYRGGWFWIDDRDVVSKRTFALVMIFSTLAETGARESLPLVTIPAG